MPSGGNLALGTPATASSTEGSFTPGSATDGNTTTRWSSDYSDPQWIQIDLQNTYTLETVVLTWEVAYGSSYRIEVSANGTDWNTAYTKTGGTGGTETITLNGSVWYRHYGSDGQVFKGPSRCL
jgi:cytochrome c